MISDRLSYGVRRKGTRILLNRSQNRRFAGGVQIAHSASFFNRFIHRALVQQAQNLIVVHRSWRWLADPPT